MIKTLFLIVILAVLIHGMFQGTVPVGFNFQTGEVYFIQNTVELENGDI